MTRYVAMARAPKGEREWWDDPAPAPTTQTVYCEDDEPVNTGLYDANGTPIYRVKDRLPIGFRKG